MKQLPYREHHLFTLLEEYENESLPLDFSISRYFRTHKALGSKDRAEIADTIYTLVRWKGLLDHLCEGTPSWEKRFEAYHSFKPESFQTDQSIPAPTRLSFPEPLYRLLLESHGEAAAQDICWASNHPAPTTVRINPLKTTRDAMVQKWKGLFELSPCVHSNLGIVIKRKLNFNELPEFKEGFFEVQDEGSQLLADLVEAEEGQHVLDFCSGSGGKTLAFAHKLKGKGQIHLHDVRPFILLEARKRLKRAGIQNIQLVSAGDPKLKRLKKHMDWVLVDAPCTGTGTLRRNPDMKWKFSEEMMNRFVGQQRMIFETALSYLKPGGKIVYGTCSLLKQENQHQVDHFLKAYPLKLVSEPLQTVPKIGEMDGFFGAVFKSH